MPVIYIDEDIDQQDRFKRYCENSGFATLTEIDTMCPDQDMEEMVRRLVSEMPLAVVSDFDFSGEGDTYNYDGLDLITALRTRNVFLPVAIITNFIEDALNQEKEQWRVFAKEEMYEEPSHSSEETSQQQHDSKSFFSKLHRTITACQKTKNEAIKEHRELAIKLSEASISPKDFERLALLDTQLENSLGINGAISLEGKLATSNKAFELLKDAKELVEKISVKLDEK